ncbi:MAG: response regulator transcription factor, partial [Sphingobacteriales bacterium]
LILTAMGTIDDKVAGLDAGADDYLVKPFHLKELLARVLALLRRQNAIMSSEKQKLFFEDLVMNMISKEVKRAGQMIELSAKEFLLLELFLKNPNRLLSRQYIAEQVWDINFETGTNVIDVYINFLRNKIDKGFHRKLIHTKINMGYILK